MQINPILDPLKEEGFSHPRKSRITERIWWNGGGAGGGHKSSTSGKESQL